MHLTMFDLDDTLLDGDCGSLWSHWMLRHGWVEDDDFLARESALMDAYAHGRLRLDDYLALTLTPLAGRHESEVAAEVARFIDAEIEPRLFPQALACLETHRRAGDRLLVISASSHHLVAPIAACLGITEVIAVDSECVDGRYSGRSLGVPSYRQGKVARLDAWLQRQALVPTVTTFYSDSHNDLPLLERVDHAMVVNPDPILATHARRRGWRHHHWARSLTHA